MNTPRVAIIGGGAAGMSACLAILENSTNKNVEVVLLEKNNSLGRKVIISGGGRCNLTTGITDKKDLKTKYVRGWDFIKFAISKYNPQYIRNYFDIHKVETKCEEDNRVFPVSNDGKDVVSMFEDCISKYQQASVQYKQEVKSIEKKDDLFILEFKNGDSQTFSDIVITTGGQAYSKTGSQGDGYKFAQDLGHAITKLGPSLNSFKTEESWIKDLSGISFKDAKIKTKNSEIHAPILLTHFGITGPLAFSLASHIPFEDVDIDKPYTINLSPIAQEDFKAWESKLINDTEKEPNKIFKNVLSKYLPDRFVESLLQEYSPEVLNKKITEVSKKERQIITKILGSGIELNLIQRRPGDEFVTAGGVETSQINKKTMESKITHGLYFAGEVVNVDGVTGGFNLTHCWASGMLAGSQIAKKYNN